MMQIANWIPTKVQTGYVAIREFCSRLPNKIQTWANSFFREILKRCQIEAWFDRTIKALTKCDYILMITSLALSTIGAYLSLIHFGIATFPLALCAGATIVGLSGLLVHQRIMKHYSRIASAHLKKMEEEAKKISNGNQNFVSLETELSSLKKPEFTHLSEKLKNLDDQTKTFKKAATKPTIEDQKAILKAHIDTIQSGNPQDQDILKNLNQQIETVGTDKQNLKDLETHKHKLRQFQSQIAISHQVELSKQINKLLKIAQGSNFIEIRKAYVKHLHDLQQNLA